MNLEVEMASVGPVSNNRNPRDSCPRFRRAGAAGPIPRLRAMASVTRKPGFAALLLLAALAAALSFSAPAHAQEGTGYEYVDLLMDYEQGPDGARASVRYSVRNIGTATATGVTVSFLLEDLDLGPFTDTPSFPDEETDNTAKTTTFTWEVGTILPGGSSEMTFATGLHSQSSSNVIGVINATAKAFQPEPGILSANNAIKIYSFAVDSAGPSLHMKGNRLALLLSVDDLDPAVGADLNFDLTAINYNSTHAGSEQFINLIDDIEIKVALSDGLEFKTGWNPTGVTVTSDRQSATWKPEAVDSRSDIPTPTRPLFRELEIQTELTSDTLAAIPLEDRCITAWVADSTPSPSADYVLGSPTQCLGDDPLLLFTEGSIGILTPFPCIGDVNHICRDQNNDNTSDSEVVVAAVVPLQDETVNLDGLEVVQSLLRSQGVGRTDKDFRGILDANYFLPEDVLIQVKDPEGRVNDTYSHSLISSGPSWQTGRKTTGRTDESGAANRSVSGVLVTWTRKAFNEQISNWTSIDHKISVTYKNGDPVTDGILLRLNQTGKTIYETDPQNTRTISLSSTSTSVIPFFFEFPTLGTYTVGFIVDATHTDTNVYSDTGSYTFHVGPIAELEVRDGTASRHPAAQRAFTIVAVNNGPDIAPAVKVTLTGLDATTCTGTATKGSLAFASSECTWTIGELKTKEVSQIDKGRDGEVLTIITTEAADTEITAEIENTQDYQVCIDSTGDDVVAANETACTGTTGNTWHTTAYYDYISGNNSATIKAKDGTGADLPSLRDAQARTAAIVVTWDPVTQLNGRPVTHYEVQKQTNPWETVADDVTGTTYVDLDVEAGDTFQYRIRAVNDWDHKGPWSVPMGATAIDTSAPGISISESELTIDEGESAEYTVTLQARPLSNVTLQVNGGGAVSPSPSRLIFTPSNFSTPQTVTLTGIQDNDAENDEVGVTHSISSSDADYRALTPEPIAVTVIDDDSAVAISSAQQSVNEGESIEFTLTRTGNIDGAITATVNVSQRGSYLASGQPGSRTVDIAAGVTTETITVATDNDTVQENPGSVTATVQGGTGYFVGTPRFATVSVADDDGPPGQPGSLAAEELDGRVRLTWTGAPSPSSAIESYSYRVRETSGGAWSPDWTVIEFSGVGTTDYTVRGLTNGTEYTIQLRARNASGDGSAAEVTANPKDEPVAPDVTVSSRSESLLVTWHVPDDGGRDITEYQVQWKSGTEAFDTSRQATATTAEHTIPDLTNDTEYQVRVRAMNEVGWGNWSSVQPGTPTPRPATSLSITTDAQDNVGQPFRVTFTFTDEEHDGTQFGVTGFDVGDIVASYSSPSYYQFALEDFRVERTGFVYSALVNQLLDGRLRIEVPAGAAKSTHDDEQESASAIFRIEVEPPPASVPSGTTLWSAEMTVGEYDGNAEGYINPDLTNWTLNDRIGSLSDGDGATDNDDAFIYSGTHYTIGEISIVRAWNTIILITCPDLEGADANFDLFLDDQVDGNRDLTLSFDPDEVDSTYQFTGTIDGNTATCVEYRWAPLQVDWQENGKVNVSIVR